MPSLTLRCLLPDPSWENHQALFKQAGLEVGRYRYYNATDHCLNMDGLLADLRAAKPGTIVLLHCCCHNPTGYDPTPQQWDLIVQAVQEQQLLPFIDMAYQGFSRGVVEDSAPVRRFTEAGLPLLVSVSFSKTFSLYGERVGALFVVCADADEAAQVHSRVKALVRTNYSNPPAHGAAIVATVLSDPALRQLWESELSTMRRRIKQMRQGLVDGLVAHGVTNDISFIVRQTGMFSYSGLSQEQMQRLRSEFAVYGTDKGRICVAALNSKNLEHVSKSIAAVMRGA